MAGCFRCQKRSRWFAKLGGVGLSAPTSFRGMYARLIITRSNELTETCSSLSVFGIMLVALIYACRSLSPRCERGAKYICSGTDNELFTSADCWGNFEHRVYNRFQIPFPPPNQSCVPAIEIHNAGIRHPMASYDLALHTRNDIV